MTSKEIKTEVRKRRDNGYDLHESVLRTEIYLEQVVENFDKLTGDNGRCAKHGKKITFLQRVAYMGMGGGAVLILLFKQGII